jgi:hypothetical protein
MGNRGPGRSRSSASSSSVVQISGLVLSVLGVLPQLHGDVAQRPGDLGGPAAGAAAAWVGLVKPVIEVEAQLPPDLFLLLTYRGERQGSRCWVPWTAGYAEPTTGYRNGELALGAVRYGLGPRGRRGPGLGGRGAGTGPAACRDGGRVTGPAGKSTAAGGPVAGLRPGRARPGLAGWRRAELRERRARDR